MHWSELFAAGFEACRSCLYFLITRGCAVRVDSASLEYKQDRDGQDENDTQSDDKVNEQKLEEVGTVMMIMIEMIVRVSKCSRSHLV